MKAVCSTLCMVRSHVCRMAARPYDWIIGGTTQTFHQPHDALLVEAECAEITALPTYGYRRAGALVNRSRAVMGLQTINHKRFYRVMKVHHLLMPKAPKLPDSGRLHVGVVAVAESNQRWCSDGFEIGCNDDDIVTGIHERLLR